MAVEMIKVNARAKEQLTTLKRRSSIRNWNVLCRWAFCLSLADNSAPASAQGPVEDLMDWHTFGGKHHVVYGALLKVACVRSGVEPSPENLRDFLSAHIHRGIAKLLGDRSIKTPADLAVLYR